MELPQEKGASIWLTALPIDIHDFALHKSAFRSRDALSLRYNWLFQNQPSCRVYYFRVISFDVWCCSEQTSVGSTIPSLPSLHGIAKRSQVNFPGGGRPVLVEMKVELMVFSSGWSNSDKVVDSRSVTRRA